jgi:hypothetical protein
MKSVEMGSAWLSYTGNEHTAAFSSLRESKEQGDISHCDSERMGL